MKSSKLLVALFLVSCTPLSTLAHASANDMISVTPTAKTPQAVADAVKAYTAEKKWIYFADGKVKNGEITLVKVCIPAAGKELFAAGLKASVLGPCGNLSIYVEKGKTEVALLNPMYMNAIYPNEHIKKAGEEAAPLLKAMVDSVTK